MNSSECCQYFTGVNDVNMLSNRMFLLLSSLNEKED